MCYIMHENIIKQQKIRKHKYFIRSINSSRIFPRHNTILMAQLVFYPIYINGVCLLFFYHFRYTRLIGHTQSSYATIYRLNWFIWPKEHVEFCIFLHVANIYLLNIWWHIINTVVEITLYLFKKKMYFND